MLHSRQLQLNFFEVLQFNFFLLARYSFVIRSLFSYFMRGRRKAVNSNRNEKPRCIKNIASEPICLQGALSKIIVDCSALVHSLLFFSLCEFRYLGLCTSSTYCQLPGNSNFSFDARFFMPDFDEIRQCTWFTRACLVNVPIPNRVLFWGRFALVRKNLFVILQENLCYYYFQLGNLMIFRKNRMYWRQKMKW